MSDEKKPDTGTAQEIAAALIKGTREHLAAEPEVFPAINLVRK